MFVLSQSVSCIPAEHLCTTWLTSRKGTIAVRAIFVWPWKLVSVSFRYLFYQPTDEKIKTWPLRFPAKENPNMEKENPNKQKALFDWPIVLQYDVKTKYRLISRKFSGMKDHEVFSPDRLLNQPEDTRVCLRSMNQSYRSISVRFLFRFCSRVFISRSNENRSINQNKKVQEWKSRCGERRST